MNYKVEIREVLTRSIDVVANSEEEALSIVRDAYENEEIVLDSDDFSYREINILES